VLIFFGMSKEDGASVAGHWETGVQKALIIGRNAKSAPGIVTLAEDILGLQSSELDIIFISGKRLYLNEANTFPASNLVFLSLNCALTV
jgi:hypothetical protein